jgi:hypothetical protein
VNIRQGLALGAVVSALAVTIGTVSAFAAVPIPGADGKIRACVKYEDINRYEQMRWITTTTCPKGEKLITWNAKGVKGEKGDKGDTGATGAPGANGAPGSSGAYFTNSNNGYVGVNDPTTIHTLTVPEGRYAVTATTEARNYYDEVKGVICGLNDPALTGITTRKALVTGHTASQVVTVIGVITTAADGKIDLVCSSLPATDSTKVAEFNYTQIMATKIG